MKHLIIVILAAIMLIGCKDKKDARLDPYASIVLNGTTAAPVSASLTKAPPAAPYSIQTITKYGFDMSFKWNNPEYPNYPGASRGFANRDVEAGKLWVGQMDDVVRPDGEGGYKLGWVATSGMHDVVLRATYNGEDISNWADPEMDSFDFKKDTIGYVPNAVITRAEAAIRTAFDAGDYEECMRLFEQAYVFIPATGPEWRALKEAGIE